MICRKYWFGDICAPSERHLFPLLVDSAYKRFYRCEPGDVVMDVGAYIGDTPLHFLWQKAAKVVAYEPIYYYWAMFNTRGRNVTVVPKGVWYKNGVMRLRVVSQDNPGWTELWGQGLIPVVDLAEELRRVKPDVLKLDCEGCEYALMRIDDVDVREINGEEHSGGVLFNRLEDLGYKIIDTYYTPDTDLVWFRAVKKK
ncbi:MAG: FkbM family methyltransferase [Thermoproteus sp.]|nr:FkbM family methyltransferase [Thermoproteus sp.]